VKAAAPQGEGWRSRRASYGSSSQLQDRGEAAKAISFSNELFRSPSTLKIALCGSGETNLEVEACIIATFRK